MKKPFTINAILPLVVAALCATAASAQDPVPPAQGLKDAFPAQKHFSPYSGRNFPSNVYWSDTHTYEH